MRQLPALSVVVKVPVGLADMWAEKTCCRLIVGCSSRDSGSGSCCAGSSGGYAGDSACSAGGSQGSIERVYLCDGDEVVLRGRCDVAGCGVPGIGFGECRGMPHAAVLPCAYQGWNHLLRCDMVPLITAADTVCGPGCCHRLSLRQRLLLVAVPLACK